MVQSTMLVGVYECVECARDIVHHTNTSMGIDFGPVIKNPQADSCQVLMMRKRVSAYKFRYSQGDHLTEKQEHSITL